jgi:hypothetical protein
MVRLFGDNVTDGCSPREKSTDLAYSLKGPTAR